MKNSILKTTAILSLGTLILIGTLSFKSIKSDFFEIAKQLEIFTTLFKELNMNYVDAVNPGELMDTAIQAMLEDLDPYTHYWNAQQVQEAKMNYSADYTGIGATVAFRNNKLVIIEPYKGYPADEAGLNTGDEIIKIDNVPVADFKESAGELLKGAPNSEVKVTYKRQGKTHNTTITLGAIEIEAVPYHKLLKNGVGYVVLSRFSRTASEETKSAIRALKEQGADKIILDLRGNPGGLLSEAMNVSNIFLPKNELITTTKSSVEKHNETFYTTQNPIAPSIPVVVLINGRSASASEIVAGALQDLDRAVILGARSFGKGLVQRPIELSYGTQVKVTIARYFTPSGRCIQALDYRNRDEKGNAIRIKKEDYNEFTTRNGRKVYDGGGIMPDISMESSKFSGITRELLQDYAIFDFATRYYYSHNLQNPNTFKFTETDYE
ncbi:MAG TPA: S41 family peptidase, partial [Salinimicrobium sp.]|nr:S41 family peptidase [Salinimicrobium sp.]